MRKLDKQLQNNILRYLRERVTTKEDPRRHGKPLSYEQYGFWRYRVQNTRAICQLLEDELLVVVVRVGHEKMFIVDKNFLRKMKIKNSINVICALLQRPRKG